ncbi:hypothetical protein GCM10011396_10390 [Undibacterium terreum]|uniref:Uncharacterized protein n=1 Tax=Undibacterium terreum TaxID=1224302 RepID=A0A916XDD2_9BURK|nr:hypothetical protein GCM10011396_10390 [Undibacterium terreum]
MRVFAKRRARRKVHPHLYRFLPGAAHVMAHYFGTAYACLRQGQAAACDQCVRLCLPLRRTHNITPEAI